MKSQRGSIRNACLRMSNDTKEALPAFGEGMLKEFLLREDVTFLNHGSYGGTPRVVHERQVKYLVEIERHTDHWYRFNYYSYLEAAVSKVAAFMGVTPRDTLLLQNVTKAINNILKTFPLHSGDAILVTTLTYVPVQCIARAVADKVPGASVHVLEIKFPIESEDQCVALYEDFLQKHPDVKVAVVDHITSPTSVILPVQRLVEVCHRYDVIVAVDGAHVPGLLQPDLAAIDADFYTGNLHKWLYTPHSCAFLWMNPSRRHDWFTPLVSSAPERPFTYEGTSDNTAYLCAMDGIDFYNNIGGKGKIIHYTGELAERGVSYLEESWGTKRLAIPPTMTTPNMRMLHLPPLPKYTHYTIPEMIRLVVERFGVQVAFASVEGELLVRVSVQVYNTMDDFVKLARAILALANDSPNV